MTKRRASPAPVQLSPDDLQVLEQIFEHWAPSESGCARNFHEIIDIALRRLQHDLNSANVNEVIEDVQREVGFRLWCTRNHLP